MNKEQSFKKYLPVNTSYTTYGKCVMAEISADDIVLACRALDEAGYILKMITALDERETTGYFRILTIFGIPEEKIFLALSLQTKKEFPSLTPYMHQASIYERKIATFFGLVPVGHPDLRSVILHENWPKDVFPLRKDFKWNTRPPIAHEEFKFRTVSGEGMYEIPVGPVHAGIIEPGHFRFSVAGEEIIYLEPRLGYSHKGTEKLFEVLELDEKVRLSERVSGDTSFAHSLAFCQAVEELAEVNVSDRVQYFRVIFLELERLANHLGDIGAIMVDTGFNFGGSNGARLREVVLRLNERLTGSRFLRGVNMIGGCTKDIDEQKIQIVIDELTLLQKDFSEVMEVAENTGSFMDRLRTTGVLDVNTAKDHGVTGIAGKAVGFARDARIDFPYAAYKDFPFEIATETSGDVYARFFVRVKEVAASFDILQKALSSLPSAVVSKNQKVSLAKNSYAVSIVEGWRGDILYFIATDSKGNISRVDVRDPSFLNWTALGHAGRGNMVPDFPLINKSFNLSYSGNDL